MKKYNGSFITLLRDFRLFKETNAGPLWILPLVCLFFILNAVVSFLPIAPQGDEAETILLAEAVLHSGLPKLTDPTHYFSNMRGADFGIGGVDTHHSWLQYYFYSIFIFILNLFNPNTGSYRLLSILNVLMLLGLIYLNIVILFRYRLSLITIIITISAVFSGGALLVHLLQVRYFIFACLSATLLLYSLMDFKNKKGLFTLSGLLLFFSQWPQAIPILFVIAIYQITDAIIAQNRWGAIRELIFPWLVISFVSISFFIVFYPLGALDLDTNRYLLLVSGFTSSVMLNMNFRLFPLFLPALLVVLLRSIFWNHKSIGEFKINMLVTLITIFTITVSTQSHVNLRIRHLVILLPFYVLILGVIIEYGVNAIYCNLGRLKIVGQVLVILIILAFGYKTKIRNDDNIVMDAINWINVNIKEDDTIYVNFDRRDLLLYTNLKVINASDFMATEHAFVKKPLPLKDDPTYCELDSINWIWWDKDADENARIKKTWLNEEYCQMKNIPREYVPVFENSRIAIYGSIK